MNVAIIGANRGIGLGFVRYYLQQGHRVWASYRHSPGGLDDIDNDHLSSFLMGCHPCLYGRRHQGARIAQWD